MNRREFLKGVCAAVAAPVAASKALAGVPAPGGIPALPGVLVHRGNVGEFTELSNQLIDMHRTKLRLFPEDGAP